MCVIKKVYFMSLTVNGVNKNQTSQPTAASTAPAQETQNLFGSEETSKTEKADTAAQKTLLEAELAKLEQQLAQLEAKKSEKEAYKKELEAQKKSITNQKANVEAQIKANEAEMKSNEEEIAKNEQNIEKAQDEIEKLQKEYDEKNKEANELSQQISDKIAKIVSDSDNNVKNQQGQIQQAYQEAYAKVESGEIEQNEVAQYVMQKVGNGNVNVATEELTAISSLNAQVKALISGANTLSEQMSLKQTEIEGYQAAITASVAANEALIEKNAPLKAQIADFNKQINTVNNEINTTDREINTIDKNIAKVNTNIQTTQNQINTIDGKETTEVKVEEVADINTTIANNNVDTNYGETAKSETKSNPFLAVSYDFGSYATMTEALEAMSKNNEQNIASARTQTESNRQEVRKMFQELIG